MPQEVRQSNSSSPPNLFILTIHDSLNDSNPAGHSCLPSFYSYLTPPSLPAPTTARSVLFEHLPGSDLHTLRLASAADYERLTPVRLVDALELCLRMTECVEAVHKAGWIHRDVKLGEGAAVAAARAKRKRGPPREERDENSVS